MAAGPAGQFDKCPLSICPTVYVGGINAVKALTGSATVFVEGFPIGRLGDLDLCHLPITKFAPTVFIGG